MDSRRSGGGEQPKKIEDELLDIDQGFNSGSYHWTPAFQALSDRRRIAMFHTSFCLRWLRIVLAFNPFTTRTTVLGRINIHGRDDIVTVETKPCF